jgi:hypothetical protein
VGGNATVAPLRQTGSNLQSARAKPVGSIATARRSSLAENVLDEGATPSYHVHIEPSRERKGKARR